jgi:hypothetical protein
MRLVVVLFLGAIAFGQTTQRDLQQGGEQDRPEALEFLHTLKKCVVDENRSCVASMVEYPIGLTGEKEASRRPLIIGNPDELVRHFDELFNPLVRKALSEESDHNLTFNWGRVYVIGNDHQIWFERTTGKEFKVTAIGVAKYHVAGVDDALAAENFFRDFQKAVKASDKRRVSAMIDYPISVIINGHQVQFENARQLRRSYDLVFNATFRKAIMKQDPSRLRANWRGLIVGDGEVWFTQDVDTNIFKIIAINP